MHLRNVLFYDCNYAFSSLSTEFHCENVTFNKLDGFVQNWGSVTFAVTNSIFCDAGTLPSMTSVANIIENDEGLIFEQAGAGLHYLSDNYRNGGTSSIEPALLQELRKRTTHRPVILTNFTFSSDQALTPTVPRDDNGAIDAGYHYDPLDYCISNIQITNSTLSLKRGVAIGVYGSKGFIFKTGGKLQSQGNPGQLNQIVRYNLVQEDNAGWGSYLGGFFDVSSVTADIRLAFTRVATVPGPQGQRFLLIGQSSSTLNPLSLSHCHLDNLNLPFQNSTWGAGTTLAFTNNIFERCSVTFYDNSASYHPFNLHLRNNLFEGGSTTFWGVWNSPWTAHDNMFNADAFTPSSITASHNAYRQGSTLGGSNNKTWLTADFIPGPLGRYYYPSSGSQLYSLINAGSRNSTNASLYHFTTLGTRETNSTVDIGFHYAAGDANGNVIDSDGDELPDAIEDANGNGQKESNESDMDDLDTDGDGQNDGQEHDAGTSLLDDQHVPWRMLASWRFSGAGLSGNLGQLPTLQNNVTVTMNGFEGNGVELSTTTPLHLQYRGIETNGLLNVSLKRGSIRFRLRTYWFSKDTSLDSGSAYYSGNGPGEWVTLVETTNLCARIDPNGTNLVVTSRSALGGIVTNLVAPIQVSAEDPRPSPNDGGVSYWYDVLITYSPSETAVYWYVPENKHTGSGIAALSDLTEKNQFIRFGSALDGTGSINGIMDEIRTYNAPGTLATNTWVASAIPSTAPVSLNLVWLSPTNSIYDLQRRIFGQPEWNFLDSVIGTNYWDADILVGERYEYVLNSEYAEAWGKPESYGHPITASVLGRPIETRGKIALLVDSTLAAGLEPELSQFITNFVGDGWGVLRANVPRHIDDYSSSTSFRTNFYNITNSIKPFVVSNYNVFTTNLKHVIVVGHVAIPYTGTTADDGHTDYSEYRGGHKGAWASDIFYGDVDGIWTDVMTATNTPFAETRNYPADGKLDQDYIPSNSFGLSNAEISVARIDFARMTEFAESESTLLKRYLAKNSLFRNGSLSFPAAATGIDLFFHPSPSDVPIHLAHGVVSKFSPLAQATIEDVFVSTNSFLFGAQSGSGYIYMINDTRPQEHTTSDIAAGTVAPNCAIYCLRGSYFPDWNLSLNNFMRATLAPTNGGLAILWNMGNLYNDHPVAWRFDSMATGMELGKHSVELMNSRIKPGWSQQTARSTQILGDSTLRYPVLPPISSLSASQSGSVVLNWSASPESGCGYFIYRSASGINGEFTRITPAPLYSTTYTDPSPPGGSLLYMVRAVNFVSTGGGSFTNLSQGVFTSP